MSVNTPKIDKQYLRYVDLLLQHHQLPLKSMVGEEEAEAVEEEMTRQWDRLDAAQRRSLSGLASDLNWVRRGCELAPQTRKPEAVKPQDLMELDQARKELDWHRVLHQLRLCASKIPTLQLANVRAAAWSALHVPRVAGLFHDKACEIQPVDAPSS